MDAASKDWPTLGLEALVDLEALVETDEYDPERKSRWGSGWPEAPTAINILSSLTARVFSDRDPGLCLVRGNASETAVSTTVPTDAKDEQEPELGDPEPELVHGEAIRDRKGVGTALIMASLTAADTTTAFPTRGAVLVLGLFAAPGVLVDTCNATSVRLRRGATARLPGELLGDL
jgi:hypothetical protein